MTPNNKTIETLLEIERITVWNTAIEACVGRLEKDVYHEAQDTEWDLGFNKAKVMCIAELEKEKK